jgi:hypothetical protein
MEIVGQGPTAYHRGEPGDQDVIANGQVSGAQPETVLTNHPESSVVVFAVWEPILPTDWSAPGANVLDRLKDRRVRQFWDSAHTVPDVLKRAEGAGQFHPECACPLG